MLPRAYVKSGILPFLPSFILPLFFSFILPRDDEEARAYSRALEESSANVNF
jgi:hypothetical protein